MTSRVEPRPSALPSRPLNDINDYDVDDFVHPFAESGKEAAQADGGAGGLEKRQDASGLGIDEAVAVNKKARVPRVKLDEKLLLSENGIPKLRRKARNLKFKGKGHEFSDAARLLSFYQLWLDDLFPKAKFLDALSMVEKAGHKSILRVKRVEWIDEDKPRPAGSGNDLDDLFGELNQSEERDPAIFPARLAPIFQNADSGERAKTPIRDVPSDDEDIYDATPRKPTNAAATKSSIFGNSGIAPIGGEPDEDDLDALMAEAEAQTTGPTSIFGSGKMTHTQNEPDEDDLDALMAEAEAEAESNTKKLVKSANHRPRTRAIVDDDDDLDALMAEAEAHGSSLLANQGPSHDASRNTREAAATNNEINEDEEAAMAEMEGLW
ncbi:Swi3-domain-containing protein [Xylaria nigripes]|nr:Swi3-domain-containing protein [Xylaria nigripes]